jgi:bacillithiol biosynthesis cysteine-adding enzyme BshC
MITAIAPLDLPAAADNKLYLDYIAGTEAAARFYAHSPADWCGVLAVRQGYPYPRSEVVPLLAEYNARLGAQERALANVETLREPDTFCVITGQQAGFLGGPAYTAFKIATTIRLAAHLQASLKVHVVPIFWLASEDHDFGEINHTYLVQRDGEIGRVGFGWAEQGRPVAALPITDEVTQAFDDYWAKIRPGSYLEQVRDLLAPHPSESYCAWSARTWSDLFADQGLVIVEPRTLRPPAGALLYSFASQSDEIQRHLDGVAADLGQAGYEPQLTSDFAGQLYTFDENGFRVRIEPGHPLDDVKAHPERYSTDAALRPLFADAMLPVIVSVLGPGETAYQGMLRPLYDLFGIPQPALFPRKSYTVVSEQDAARIAEYQTSIGEILTERMDGDAVFRDLIPVQELEMFATVQRDLATALEPLRPYLEDMDPSLGKTWSQTLANVDRGLEKLRERAFKARMSQLGFSKGELRRLENVVLPRGRLQERVLPLPHYLNQFGPGFVDQLLTAGDLFSFDHQVLVLEDEGV